MVNSVTCFVELQASQPFLNLTEYWKGPASGLAIQGIPAQIRSLRNKLMNYKDGTLTNNKKKRAASLPYPEIEKMLVEYINLRSMRYRQDSCGLSWLLLQERCIVRAQKLDSEHYKDFKAS